MPVSESQIRRIYGDTIDALYAYVSRRCGVIRENRRGCDTGNIVAGRRTWARDGIPSGAIAPVSSPRGRSPTHWCRPSRRSRTSRSSRTSSCCGIRSTTTEEIRELRARLLQLPLKGKE